MSNISINTSINIHQIVSINDLRDKYYNGVRLTEEERQALERFDHYRLEQLNSQKSEELFHKEYLRLQILANLNHYTEFLQEKFQ